MKNLRVIDWAGVVAVLTFAFFLGELYKTVSGLESGKTVENQKIVALAEIKAAKDDLTKNQKDFIGMTDIINTVVCTQPTKDCEHIASDARVVEVSFPVNVPLNRKLLGAFYQPIGDPGGIAGFGLLFVTVSSRNTIVLHAQGSPGKLGQVRIFISGIYGPE